MAKTNKKAPRRGKSTIKKTTTNTSGRATATTARKLKPSKANTHPQTKPPKKGNNKPVATNKGKATSTSTKATKTNKNTAAKKAVDKKVFPDKFPFWARILKSKTMTTLVIDEVIIFDKQSNKSSDNYVHREATHTNRKDFERIIPNPDRGDSNPMYLRQPRKLAKTKFIPHNKKLDMPNELKERYEKNNIK